MKGTATTKQAAFDQAWAMFESDANNDAIMEATGLNYSQMWCDRTRRQLEADMLPGHTFLTMEDAKGKPLSNTAIAAQVAKRRQAGDSWGLIGVKARMPESRIRKLFTEATAIDHKGLRNGKGGRWVADDVSFYSGSDRAKFGTELDPSRPILEQRPDVNTEQPRVLPVLTFTPSGKAKVKA